MLIFIKGKAFIGFSLMLISMNAFPSIENQYLHNLFISNKKVNLIAEDLEILNAKKYIKLNLDPISQSIFLNQISQQEKSFSLNSSSLRINYFSQLSNHQALANIYQVLALSNINNLEEAKIWFLKAYNQFELLHHQENIGVVSQNLSWLYYVKGDLDNALLFNKIAISSLNLNPNKKLLFGLLVWQNDILLAEGKAVQVENEILKNMLIMATRNNKKIQEWECFYQLGKSYLLQNKLVQAKWFFIQALTLAENFDNKIPKLKSLLMLARAKRRSNDYSLALQNIKSAQDLIQKSTKVYQIDVSKQFAEVYHHVGDKSKEYQYITAYNRLKNTTLIK